MKYSLDIYIVTNNQLILDTIKTNIPSKLDTIIWANEYTAELGIDLRGNKYVNATIRFNDMPNRKIIRDKIQDRLTPTVLSQILKGSYIRLHTCNHDDRNKTTGCIETEIWSK